MAGRLALLHRFTVAAVGFALVSSGCGAGNPPAAHSHSRPTTASPPRASGAPAGKPAARRGLQARGIATITRLSRLGLPIYCAGRRGNEVAFTFDDGPGPYTYLALRKLTQAGERATFFVVGRSMDNFPGWVSRELAVAEIGDHTYTHPELTQLAPAQVVWQLVRTSRKIKAGTAQPVVLFRPPYGARDPLVDHIARALGLLEIMWSTDSRDSLGADWLGIIRNVDAGLHPGAIILMHENHGQTIRALPTILSELHRRHLRSVTLPELFASDPPSVRQVREGLAGCTAGGAPARSGS